MRRSVGASNAAVILSAVLLGCGHMSTDNTADNLAPLPQEITAVIVDRSGYDTVIAQHVGKVILVDFWATWCPPCVEEFPHSVQLSRKFDSADFAVVSVSMDEPTHEKRVLRFLRENDASFDNLISSYGVGQESFAAFEITDGAVPHYKLYDRTGTVRHVVNSNEGIEKQVAALLDEQ